VDEHQPDVPRPFPGWLEWAIIIALVVVVAIAAYVLLSPQIANTFNNVNNEML
jgi:Flp pilus assembly pilin Flp